MFKMCLNRKKNYENGSNNNKLRLKSFWLRLFFSSFEHKNEKYQNEHRERG